MVELIGGLEPARELVEAALAAGKPVVTANKELLAAPAARAGRGWPPTPGVDLLYEAAVAGAIPLIRPLRESLAGERIRRVMGIVNGTTNFILTRMAEEGVDYADALAEAQALGLAERDPTADVEGHDAAAKAAILAALAFRCDVVADDVHREGITGIDAVDIAVRRAAGLRRQAAGRRRAVGRRTRASRCGSTRPWCPTTHPLAAVRGAFNAVFIEGDGSRRADALRPGCRRAARRPAPCSATSSTPPATCWPAPPAPAPERQPAPRCARSTTCARACYLSIDVADRPGVLGRGGQGVRRPRRVDPVDGAGGPGRRGPADLPHPPGPRGRRAGAPSPSCAASTSSTRSAACCGSSGDEDDGP